MGRLLGKIAEIKNWGGLSTDSKGTGMFELKLREEFRGKRLKGTTVDFTNQSKTGALEIPAAEFLEDYLSI